MHTEGKFAPGSWRFVDMLNRSLVPETADKDCISTCGGDTASLKPSWSHGSHARQRQRAISVE